MEPIISPKKANSQTRDELAEEGKEKKKREVQSKPLGTSKPPKGGSVCLPGCN